MPKLRQPLPLRLLLAVVLVLAQTLLLAHGIEHLGHGDADACEVCVTGAPLGAALVAAQPGLAPRDALTLPPSAALTRVALRAPFNPHAARAPPAPIRP